MKPVPRLRFQLIVAVLVRLVLNVAHRMVYPFLAVFASRLLIIALADVPFDENISGPDFDHFAILATNRHRISGVRLG